MLATIVALISANLPMILSIVAALLGLAVVILQAMHKNDIAAKVDAVQDEILKVKDEISKK